MGSKSIEHRPEILLVMEHSSIEYTATQSNKTGEEAGQTKLNSHRKSLHDTVKFFYFPVQGWVEYE